MSINDTYNFDSDFEHLLCTWHEYHGIAGSNNYVLGLRIVVIDMHDLEQ